MLNELIKLDIICLKSYKLDNLEYISEFYNKDCKNFKKLVESIYYSLLIEKNKPLKIKKMIKMLKNNFNIHSYKNLSTIDNSEKYVIALIAFFIAKKIILIKNKSIDFEEEIINKLDFENLEDISIISKYFSSDSIINYAYDNFFKIFLWQNKVLNNSETKLINEDDFRLCGEWILNFLYEKKILIKTTKNIQNKTHIYYDTVSEDEYKPIIEIFISYEKYNFFQISENKYYIYNQHFSTIKKIFKENKYSGYSIEITDNNFINNILNTSIMIDNNRLDYIITESCKNYNIKREEIEKSYIQLLENHKKFIRENKKEEISLTSKLMSKYINIIKLIKILKKNTKEKKIYSDIMICFRGRLFFLSTFSLTFQKELRFCSFQGYYEKNPHIYEHTFLKQIENELKKTWKLMKNLKNYNFSLEKSEVKNSIIWILVAVGEINKKKYDIITLEKFVEMGIEIINLYDAKNYDFENKIKISYYINILDEIKNYPLEKRKKWLLSKDATASVFQHMIKVLGSKNEEALKWCNLTNNSEWRDTYAYIIKNFINSCETKKLTKNELLEIFSRKNLKNTIMTESYGAVKSESLKKFLKKISHEALDDIYKREEIIEIFNKFFNNLKINENLFNSHSDIIIKEIMTLDPFYIITHIDGTKINLSYYIEKKKNKQIEGLFNNIRYTKQKKILDNIINKRKMKTTLRANFIQAQDGSLVRWYYSKENNGITIHDCFMVDYMQTTYLIAIINEGMNKNFHNIENLKNDIEIFSIFIIL